MESGATTRAQQNDAGVAAPPQQLARKGPPLARRSFLCAAAASVTAARRLRGDDGRPPVTSPRATAFDARVEPDWEERITVTVGPEGSDIVGTGQRALQGAIDQVARLGGGTVQIGPGRYVLRAAVHLRCGVRLVGSGPDTVITKIPSHSCGLAADSDWYDREITLTPGHGFRVGDSICLRSLNPHDGGQLVFKRVLVARSGDRFKLDKALRDNVWSTGKPTVSALFPLLSGEEIENVVLENLHLDGDRVNNENLDGNYSGCIFLQDCRDVAIRGVEARNSNGDGISFQICHDIVVEGCTSRDHAGLGLHPGSGSQRPLMRSNTLAGNSIGIFFCWGVKYGLAEDNDCSGNDVGISIGHRDTDNVVRGNRIAGSRTVGLLFRPERGATFCGHRNRIDGNTFADNGGDAAAVIDVQGGTEEVALVGNTITESRGAAMRVGIRLGADTKNIRLDGNSITGVATPVERLS